MSNQHAKGLVLQDVLFLLIGILSSSIGLRSFLAPNHFLDGGVTGLALLIHEVTDWHLGWLLILLNLPFVLMGYKLIGKMFAIRTAIAVIGVSLCLQYIHLPELTDDLLLVAVFGGFFLGLGIGLCM